MLAIGFLLYKKYMASKALTQVSPAKLEESQETINPTMQNESDFYKVPKMSEMLKDQQNYKGKTLSKHYKGLGNMVNRQAMSKYMPDTIDQSIEAQNQKLDANKLVRPDLQIGRNDSAGPTLGSRDVTPVRVNP